MERLATFDYVARGRWGIPHHCACESDWCFSRRATPAHESAVHLHARLAGVSHPPKSPGRPLGEREERLELHARWDSYSGIERLAEGDRLMSMHCAPSIVDATLAYLREAGDAQRECVVLWLGRREDTYVRVVGAY